MTRKTGQKGITVTWRNSLIFRVVLLCVVLVFCLLGSVWVITRHYFREISEEMLVETREIASSVELLVDDNPGADLDSVLSDIAPEDFGVDDVAFDRSPHPLEREGVSYISENGQVTREARQLITVQGQQVLLTVRVTLTPQTEILRAFKNKYIAALTLVFILALGFMVYFVVRLLKPLRDLSDSCAEISEGNLRDVVVKRNSGEILALEQTFNSMVASLREKEMVESKLRQAQRLSAIGNLAAGVAHDIRNPLNAIKLLSSHTIDILGDSPDGERAVKQLRTIRNEVDQLEEIVSNFLSLAKERELQPEPSRIDALLAECVRLIGKDAEAREVQLVSELRAGDTELMLDPKQWARAILNVLINAMEACPKGGRVRLFSRLTDRTCEVEIRDDGPGLSEEAAERAFEPYFTTKTTGTGLGLAITRGVIEEHGGTIELSGQEGRGCQVLIVVPLTMESQ